MRSDEAIAMLGVGAIEYKIRVDSRSIANIDWQTIAGALGAVRHPGADLLRTMYGADERACRYVLRRLKGALLGKGDNIDAEHQIAVAALKDFVCPPLCPTCGGRGSMLFDQLKVECQPCEGSGLRRTSRADDKLSVMAYRLLRTWHDSALSIVYQQLNGD